MEHKDLGKLKDNVEDALKKIIAKGEDISPAELDVATKAVCLIDKIRDVEMGDDEGYSGRGGRSMRSYDMMYGRNGNSYDDDFRRYGGDWRMGYPMPPMSYDYDMDRGGRSYRGGGGRGSSRDGGYSGHDLKGRMLEVLDRMRGEAHNERERKMVEDWTRIIASAED